MTNQTHTDQALFELFCPQTPYNDVAAVTDATVLYYVTRLRDIQPDSIPMTDAEIAIIIHTHALRKSRGRVHLPLAYYETDKGLAVLCKDCAIDRENNCQTCQYFDALEDNPPIELQCEDCGALPTQAGRDLGAIQHDVRKQSKWPSQTPKSRPTTVDGRQ